MGKGLFERPVVFNPRGLMVSVMVVMVAGAACVGSISSPPRARSAGVGDTTGIATADGGSTGNGGGISGGGGGVLGGGGSAGLAGGGGGSASSPGSAGMTGGGAGSGGAMTSKGGAAGAVIVDPPFTGQTGTIMFVTQVPVGGFATLSANFSNHTSGADVAPRGGDLMIRYPDASLRYLTREAGFTKVAVRQPCVHWSGNKAIFSMIVDGSNSAQGNGRWQMYEVTGIGKGGTAVVTYVPNQPPQYNNISPIYATSDRIIFTTDRPRRGETHLYPQLDEYESKATTTGLWRLDPTSGELLLLEHAPSGVFYPSVDSFGRVIFTKWDHLQRDQQVQWEETNPSALYQPFTFSDESAAATKSNTVAGIETYPEQHEAADPGALPNTSTLRFNEFFPWEINEDGTREETLNHVGRHELGGSYTFPVFLDDPNLTDQRVDSIHKNTFFLNDDGLYHFREDPRDPGTFFATKSPEFGTPNAGTLVKLTGAPLVNPEDMVLTPVTDPNANFDTAGFFRTPLPMSDGTLIAVYSPTSGATPAAFRLRTLTKSGTYYVAGATLTTGLTLATKALWEFDPIEVIARPRPMARQPVMEDPETSVFTSEGVDIAVMQAWLKSHDLALIISRNVTLRDRGDMQQPYNLRVPGGVQNVPSTGKVYDIAYLQLFEADQLRGYGGTANPTPGRRPLATPIHGASLPAAPVGGPVGSVKLGADGSMAAFVPAQRALSWQLVAPDAKSVVRERNWVSFQAGEIRTCPVCHGLNRESHGGEPTPTNSPQALRDIVRYWKTLPK